MNGSEGVMQLTKADMHEIRLALAAQQNQLLKEDGLEGAARITELLLKLVRFDLKRIPQRRFDGQTAAEPDEAGEPSPDFIQRPYGGMSIGGNIRRIREERGLTQAYVAERAGISIAMLCQVEHGLKNPSLRVGVEIARLLGCEASDLVDDLPPYDQPDETKGV